MEKVKLDIFVDESSVEVYGQDGQVTGALAVSHLSVVQEWKYILKVEKQQEISQFIQ